MLGYLAAAPSIRCMRLALMFLALGPASLTFLTLTPMGIPMLRDVIPEFSSAASPSVLKGPDVVHDNRVRADVGVRDFDRPAVLAGGDQVGSSRRTRVDARMHRRAEVWGQGFAIVDGKTDHDLYAVAAPVLDVSGHVRAGIGLAVRFERQELEASPSPAPLQATEGPATVLHKIDLGAEPARYCA
ncbi:MAG: hypothetical protein M3N26_03000 [Pseudomonadota bacterium]|nr:hypothetical protein [Pseudomonadota bacterium]